MRGSLCPQFVWRSAGRKSVVAMAEEQSVDERVRTAQVEARARNISHNVRCLECGHQSIEESAADIAVRLRKVVHTTDLQLLALPMAN